MYEQIVSLKCPIRLKQFVKLANISETGGMAGELIASGFIEVNGEAEYRPGRQLNSGDTVTLTSPGGGYSNEKTYTITDCSQ